MAGRTRWGDWVRVIVENRRATIILPRGYELPALPGFVGVEGCELVLGLAFGGGGTIVKVDAFSPAFSMVLPGSGVPNYSAEELGAIIRDFWNTERGRDCPS